MTFSIGFKQYTQVPLGVSVLYCVFYVWVMSIPAEWISLHPHPAYFCPLEISLITTSQVKSRTLKSLNGKIWQFCKPGKAEVTEPNNGKIGGALGDLCECMPA